MAVRGLTLGLVLSFAAASCGKQEEAAPKEAPANAHAPAEASLLGTAEVPDFTPPARGCGSRLKAELDRESLAQALGRALPSAPALEEFRARAGAAFQQAAANLCRNGSVAPAMLKSFTTIIVQNGAGATETAVYEDPHEFRSEDLIFQWTFAEGGLKLPPLADIEKGISCWNDPDQPSCTDRMP
jgi:hypothetical protein